MRPGAALSSPLQLDRHPNKINYAHLYLQAIFCQYDCHEIWLASQATYSGQIPKEIFTCFCLLWFLTWRETRLVFLFAKSTWMYSNCHSLGYFADWLHLNMYLFFYLHCFIFFLDFRFSPSGHSRLSPSGVGVCSGFLPTGAFFRPLSQHCVFWRGELVFPLIVSSALRSL